MSTRRSFSRAPAPRCLRVSIAALLVVAASVASVAMVMPTAAHAVPGALAPGAGGFVAVAPFRLVDTRLAAGSPGAAYAGPRFEAFEIDTFQVYSPDDATLPPGGIGSVVLNVTAVGAAGPGFVTVWPADRPRPVASVLNVSPGQTVPNAVTVGLSKDLRFSVYSTSALDLVVDVMGIYAAAPSGPGGGGFAAVSPRRLLDTRAASPVGSVVAQPGAQGKVTLTGLVVTGGDVASGAVAVVLNVTAVPNPDGSSGPGFVTAFPGGIAAPTASNLNYSGPAPVANQVTVRVGTKGEVWFVTQTAIDLVVDVMGYYAAGPTVAGGFVPVDPTRLADTRQPAAKGYVYDGATNSFVVSVVTRAGVPVAAEAAAVNVTVTEPTADGFVTVWPDDLPRPLASNLNYVEGQTVPNAVTVGLGRTGAVELFTLASAELVVDVNGWFTSPYPS
jgi:hypothetical protein